MSLISSNSPNLREDDVINEARNGAYLKPVSAYQMKLANERIDTSNTNLATTDAVVAKTVKMISIPITADAKTAEIAFSNEGTGLKVGDTILEILLVCDTAVTGGTMTLKHGGESGAAISSVLTCAVANAVSRTTLLASPVITADGLSVLGASADDRGTFTIMYI